MAAEPLVITAGTTLSWYRSLTEYQPADGWSLRYTFVNASARYEISGAQVTADAVGAGWDISVPASVTSTWAPGAYEWRAFVEDATQETVYLVDGGSVDIASDGSSVGDIRSRAKTALDALDAVLEGRATKDQEEMSINGRMLKRFPLSELLALRAHFQSKVNAEDGRSRMRRVTFG